MAVTGVGGIRLIPWVVGLVEKLLMEEEDGGAMVAAAIPFNAILIMEIDAGPTSPKRIFFCVCACDLLQSTQ